MMRAYHKQQAFTIPLVSIACVEIKVRESLAINEHFYVKD